MRQNLFRPIGIALYAILVASCADDVPGAEPGIEPGDASDKICFMESAEATPRGNRIDGLRGGGAYIKSADGVDSLYLGLTVSDMPAANASRAAHITTNDYDLRMTCLRRRTGNVYDYYFANVEFTKGNDGIWASDPEYWWLDADTNIKFYGYAPADVSGATFIADEQTWEPKLDYIVPSDARDQTDLLYSKPMASDAWMIATPQPAVGLNMKHALACVGFKTGHGMAAGTINRIIIRNAAGRGVFNLADEQWTLDTKTPSLFTADIGKETLDDIELTGDEEQTYFMMLPGSNIEGTTVEIDFTSADGKNNVYVGGVNGDWKAGKQYMYTITLSPELDIDIVPETQDAHYVICQARVVADNMQAGQQWTLSVSASDGADVTITDELNVFQRYGYWIDEIREPDKDPIPARGTSTLTSTGDRDIYIFLPENVSFNNRTITMRLRVAGTAKVVSERTFEQVCPAWVGTYAWEQMDEGYPVQYGFDWSRVAYYEYLYSAPLSGNTAYRDYCQSLIDDNYADNYARVETFNDTPNSLRYMIVIDYTKLTSLVDVAEEQYDGWYNTKRLYDLGGTGTLGAFEAVLANIYKTESGFKTERAFRLGNGKDGEAPAPEGNDDVALSAVGMCMLKNRWHLVKSVSAQGDEVYVPYIDEEDIVWYLSAVDQFKRLPEKAMAPVDPADCWSSTATQNTVGQAYLGNGIAEDRMRFHKVRACRK